MPLFLHIGLHLTANIHVQFLPTVQLMERVQDGNTLHGVVSAWRNLGHVFTAGGDRRRFAHDNRRAIVARLTPHIE